MADRFVPRIPKTPILKRETYRIPQEYINEYEKEGIKNFDEQMMLFHTTQFGGFRIKRVPKGLRIKSDFTDWWFKHECERGVHSFKANSDFIGTFGSIEVKPLLRIWRGEPISEDEMEEAGIPREEYFSPYGHSTYDFLVELNEFYSSLRIGIDCPDSGITAEDRIKLSRLHSIPFLVKKPKAGGRLFHPGTSYQRISSSLRPFLTINREATAEIDISAATIQFLSIVLKKQALGSLEEIISSNGDPYNHFLSALNAPDFLRQYQETPIDREPLKTLLYTAVYSSASREESNVNRKLRLMRREYRYKDLVQLFPEFFGALSRLREKTGKPLHMAIYGEESRYAEFVLKEGCLGNGIPILPIHDSFITPKICVAKLKGVMDYVAEQLYGKKLRYKRKY